MSASGPRRLVVIGGGIVGVASAIEALRDGHGVAVVDPGPIGGEQAASYGNAGWLSSHSVIPPAEPGVWRKAPGYLLDPLGPLAVRPAYLAQAFPWLLRYLASGWTWARVEQTARSLRALLRDAPALHEALAEEAGVSHLIERRGVMHVYPSRAPFDADAMGWDMRRRMGVDWSELSSDELREREPDLHRRYTFGVMVEEAGHCRDPSAYVAGLAALARARGAEFVSARADGFRIERGALKAVATDAGEIACDAAIVAAGARSRQLCRSLGDALPLETERGYHAMILDAEAGPRLSLMASDAKMVVNRMEGGLRGAGQVEIAGLDAAPDWRRADILRDHLLGMFPSLPKSLAPERVQLWMGHRPSMPDGRPCIGRSRASVDVIYAFGHGHVELVGSARTARLVAQLVAGRVPEIDLSPFDPRRYLERAPETRP